VPPSGCCKITYFQTDDSEFPFTIPPPQQKIKHPITKTPCVNTEPLECLRFNTLLSKTQTRSLASQSRFRIPGVLSSLEHNVDLTCDTRLMGQWIPRHHEEENTGRCFPFSNVSHLAFSRSLASELIASTVGQSHTSSLPTNKL
jgi:hypothetical protein